MDGMVGKLEEDACTWRASNADCSLVVTSLGTSPCDSRALQLFEVYPPRRVLRPGAPPLQLSSTYHKALLKKKKGVLSAPSTVYGFVCLSSAYRPGACEFISSVWFPLIFVSFCTVASTAFPTSSVTNRPCLDCWNRGLLGAY